MSRLFSCLSSAFALAGVLAFDTDRDDDCSSALQITSAAALKREETDNVCGSVHLTHHLPASLAVLPAEAVQPKIFDFFLFAFPAEVPVLELRLAEMADSVDGIFIVEADRDFQGHPRELLLRTMLQEEPLRSYADKLFIVEVNLPEISQDHDRFGGTYNVQTTINNMVYVAGDVIAEMPGADLSRDMIIQSDLDEIIGRHALAALKQCRLDTNSPTTWPLMMTDMDHFQDGFRHKMYTQWALGPILGPVDEVLGFRTRPEAFAPHSIFDGSGNPVAVAASAPLWEPESSVNLLKGASGYNASTKGVYRPTDVKIAVTAHTEATGWHMSWSLSDEGTARKLHARAGGLPNWASGLDDEALVAEVRHRRVTSTPLFDEHLGFVFNDARRLPEAVKQHPERFASFLPTPLLETLESFLQTNTAIPF